jgi:serine/threonine protein kinase
MYYLLITIILTHNENRYEVVDVLGSGTFGQVVKCRDLTTGQLVAIKVIKNKPAYTKQGLIELDILKQVKYTLLFHLSIFNNPDQLQ